MARMGRVRWWPAAAVAVLGAAWLARVWMTGDATGQARVTQTMATLAVVVLLLLIWLAAFSGLSRRVRAAGLGAVAAAIALFLALFRIQGVTGDLVPVVRFRWARQPPLPTPTASVGAPVGVVSPPPTAPGDAASETHPLPPVAADAPAPTVAGRAAADPEADYPQFLGPGRDGILTAVKLSRDWSARPPRRLWRQPIGAAWSGFAVAGDTAVTQEQRGDDELVVAYDLHTGAVRWIQAERARYATVIAGVGPRATPSIADGRVYAMGATGLLSALDLRTGARLWRKDVLADNQAPPPEWGASGSPLVLDGRVIVSAGGAGGRSLVAYDAATGDRVWSAGDDRSAYASPMLATLASVPQVLIFNAGSVASHDPQSGALLWRQDWPATQPNVAQPLVLGGDRVLVSAGYGIGSKLFGVRRDDAGGFSVARLWESPRLKAKFTNLVQRDGFVYGLDDGVLVCLDPATGERRWKEGRYGHGQVLLVGDLLLVQTEEGEIVLVEPRPDARVEVARFAALDGKTWNPPALAGRLLLVRNEREAACYELPVE
jgi:outer membrane protein assembly factor BamB